MTWVDFSQIIMSLQGDIGIYILDGSTEIAKIWLHTDFIDQTGRLQFSKEEMDFQTDDDKFSKGFMVEIDFRESNLEIEEMVKESERLFYDPLFNDY